MSLDPFHLIGVIVVAAATLAGAGFSLIALYGLLLHGRFNAILFKRGGRRLSIASWHATRVRGFSPDESADNDWPADDYVIGERPLYLSYKVGEKRIFVMAGTLHEWRNSSIRGTHP